VGEEGKPRDIKDRTFDFAVEIVQLCQDLDKTPGTTRTLGRQLLRSGTSIGANVEEAQGWTKAGQISSASTVSH
jgi:four helix bundle protein